MLNPAEKAARLTLERVLECVRKQKSFLVEAGAGAGKTHTLISTLQYLIGKQGVVLLRRRQRVACITYTNVAKDEIESRTDRHGAVYCDTIHGFCWSAIKGFQRELTRELARLEAWKERLRESGGVGDRIVDYSLGHRAIAEGSISIHHDDVIALFVALMEFPKFRAILTSRYPILLIDEYQDTNAAFASSIGEHFLGKPGSPLVGFFGDHWQMIYRGVCGKIEHHALERIKKGSNFRSVRAIVDVLNRMRPELPQEVTDPRAEGFVGVFHTNEWAGKRRTEGNWRDDLPPEAAHAHLEALIKRLSEDGWDFAPSKTKILMLTHNVLAAEQGYQNLAAVFAYNDSYVKKEDPHISFLLDTLEPVCAAYEEGRLGEMFAVVGSARPSIRSYDEKLRWAEDMDRLLDIRRDGTVGAVVDCLRQTHHPPLPDAIERRELELERLGQQPELGEQPSLETLQKLRGVPYREVIALDRFLDERTPFSTKHGVKGAEFENVLVVFGRAGWSMYNFSRMLEWAPDRCPTDKRDFFERNRNLFYVVCSRPRKRLSLLFTQKLSEGAMETLAGWFGSKNIHSFRLDG